VGPGVGGGPVVVRVRVPGEAICQAWLDIVGCVGDLMVSRELENLRRSIDVDGERAVCRSIPILYVLILALYAT
jgi:hypothetical protein